jgi:hypothetical protein
MRHAGFRVLGFGIESFSERVLGEFNKAHIFPHIEPMLNAALATGITPFLDLILSSPRATLDDIALTLRQAYQWMRKGCEIGMYPYVIPFSGAAFSNDPLQARHTRYAYRNVAGTSISWRQPVKILPHDPQVMGVILRIERAFEAMLAPLETQVAHLPSRVRSLLWILASLPVMAEHGFIVACESDVRAELCARLPAMRSEENQISAVLA